MHSLGIINTIFAIVFAITLVAFVWGLVMYFAEFGSEHGKREYKGLFMGAITLLLVEMCVFWVVDWVRGTLGF